MARNNNNNPQIMVYAYLYKSNTKKYKEQLRLCKLLNNKLKAIGYEVKHFDDEYRGSYFLTIYKKDKMCGWNTSILCACCMGSLNRSPISIETFIKYFDLIMDPKMNDKCWVLMEQIAYHYNNQ